MEESIAGTLLQTFQSTKFTFVPRKISIPNKIMDFMRNKKCFENYGTQLF